MKMGFTGIEMVVLTTIALAAFLPSIVLDWRVIVERAAGKTNSAQAVSKRSLQASAE